MASSATGVTAREQLFVHYLATGTVDRAEKIGGHREE